MVIAATDMCGKNPSRESGYMGLHENIHFYHYYLVLSFITSVTLLTVQFIFQLLFHRNYYFCYCYYYYSYLNLLSLLSLLLMDDHYYHYY